jgi:hypothetical protein
MRNHLFWDRFLNRKAIGPISGVAGNPGAVVSFFGVLREAAST